MKKEDSGAGFTDLRIGTIEALFYKLGGVEGVNKLLNDETRLEEGRYLINCDADPFIPDGWKIKEHKKIGQLEWDIKKIQLHLEENQKKRAIYGTDIKEGLKSLMALNANVLDFLLNHTHLIPREWENIEVVFWGTIYYYNETPYVRCLSLEKVWCWKKIDIKGVLHSKQPAAFLAD